MPARRRACYTVGFITWYITSFELPFEKVQSIISMQKHLVTVVCRELNIGQLQKERLCFRTRPFWRYFLENWVTAAHFPMFVIDVRLDCSALSPLNKSTWKILAPLVLTVKLQLWASHWTANLCKQLQFSKVVPNSWNLVLFSKDCTVCLFPTVC